MRYAQFDPTCDVCVSAEHDAGLDCVGCDQPGHHAHDTDEMISHLRVHQAYGDRVPMGLIHRLEESRDALDGVSGPHTCHDGPCALCDPDDGQHPARTPRSVMAAFVGE